MIVEKEAKEGMFDVNFEGKFKRFSSKVEKMNKDRKRMIQQRSEFEKYLESNFEKLLEKKKVKTLNSLLVKITAMLNCGNLSLGEASPWESISLSESKINDLYSSKKSDRVRMQA